MFESCNGQLRICVSAAVAPNGAVKVLRFATGLDFAAVLALAEAMGAKSALLAEMLPEIEAYAVRGFNRSNE